MKVLVTGGTGFLGRHLVERLALEGDEVWVLARGGKSDAELRGLGVHVVAGDVRQWSSLRDAVKGMDVIYHCAGKVEAGGRWLDFLEVNVLGTERLIQASSSTAWFITSAPSGSIPASGRRGHLGR
jgi:nucleoside-diphosphate-sugar epimerase